MDVQLLMIWTKIKDDIAQIYMPTPNVTSVQIVELFRRVFDYCTNATISYPSKGREFIANELYQNLKNFIEDSVTDKFQATSNLNGEELLSFYTTKWDEYQRSSRLVDRVFDYLNRHWVRREREEGNKDAYRVYDLAILTWREHLFKKINQRLTSSILNLIERQRNGEIINANLITKAIASYIELGIDEYKPFARGVNLSVYKECFEKQFIEETERYYTAEADGFIQQNVLLSKCLIHADKRIKEERERVEAYLHKSTLTPLLEVCNRVLVERFSSTN